MFDFLQALTYVLAMLICLSVHEAAHGFVAFLRGDNTAKLDGRMTLNPAAHIDPLGTLVLPFIGALTHFPIIGWAKPVPVDERNFKNPKLDHLMVSLAGPASNFIFSAICIAIVGNEYVRGMLPPGSILNPVLKLGVAMAYVNAGLAFFNMLPIPPLDGAAVVRTLLPDDMAEKYDQVLGQWGFFLILMLAMSGGLNWIGALIQAYVRTVEAIIF